MGLQEHIRDIQTGLRSGPYVNEASVSQGIILRILQALEWPIFDSNVVSPEYASGRGRVDLAVCHPPRRPIAFIEIKRIGQTEGSDRQLFEYAFHEGVPLVVLTNGQEWHFYVPGEQGPYDEWRMYKLDVLEREIAESENRLLRYLAYRASCSGATLEAARQDYRDAARERQIRSELPRAWAQLVEEQDDILLELLADKVETLCGYSPDKDTVAAFLIENVRGLPRDLQRSRPVRPVATAPSPRVSQELTRLGFRLDGREFPASSARQVLTRVFEELAARDKTFLERFGARPRHGRRRRYVAKAREKLYPDRPDLSEEYSHDVGRDGGSGPTIVGRGS